MRVAIKNPLSRRNVRPRGGDAQPADASPEKNAHANLWTAFEADTLERQSNLDHITIVGDAARAIPDPVRFPALSGRGGIQRVHLNAAGVDHHVIRRLTVSCSIEAEADPIV